MTSLNDDHDSNNQHNSFTELNHNYKRTAPSWTERIWNNSIICKIAKTVAVPPIISKLAARQRRCHKIPIDHITKNRFIRNGINWSKMSLYKELKILPWIAYSTSWKKLWQFKTGTWIVLWYLSKIQQYVVYNDIILPRRLKEQHN